VAQRVGSMSGPICKHLGPSRARLQGYIKNPRVIFMTPISEKDLEKEEAKIEDLHNSSNGHEYSFAGEMH